MKEIINYIKINKNIATAGQPSKKQFKKIAKKNYDVVINLAPHDASNAIKNEDKVVLENNMLYINIPIDWKNPQYARMILFLELLKQLTLNNKKVFIHCAKNYRVSVFMHQYKKVILNQSNVKFISPKDYKPSKKWNKFINKTISL